MSSLPSDISPIWRQYRQRPRRIWFTMADARAVIRAHARFHGLFYLRMLALRSGLDAVAETLFGELELRRIEPSRSDVVEQLRDLAEVSQSLAKRLMEGRAFVRQLVAVQVACRTLYPQTCLALVDAAAGPEDFGQCRAGFDRLGEGRARLESMWRILTQPEGLLPRDHLLRAVSELSAWATAAAGTGPVRTSAAKTEQAIARRAAFLVIEIVQAQTGKGPALSRRYEESKNDDKPRCMANGTPDGPWIRLLEAFFAQLRRSAARFPETRPVAGNPVLAPGRETLAEWLRMAMGDSRKRRADKTQARRARSGPSMGKQRADLDRIRTKIVREG